MTSLCDFRLSLPATPQALEQFCRDFRNWISSHCASTDVFALELTLREVLVNALVHGSQGIAGASIHCRLRVRRNLVLINVKDNGPGFDWRSAWDKQAQLTDTGGRGVEILRKYASRVRFSRLGNAVTLIRHLEWKDYRYGEK